MNILPQLCVSNKFQYVDNRLRKSFGIMTNYIAANFSNGLRA